MGSKGRIPPPHPRHPLAGSNIVHPDPFGPGIRPFPGALPPFERLPPPEVLEQKLAAQHVEMQRLATENQRLAATHGTLRQELAAAQHELHVIHAQIGGMKSEREQQMRSLVDKIAKMEAELKAAEPVKIELQQARADAQNMSVERQGLFSKAQQLTQDMQRARSDLQQIPALMSELESLRQEYHHCRVTYDYEKKLYNDHLESLQVMEKNYITMAREVEKLRAELTNTANVDRRAVAPYGGTTGNIENEAASGHPITQNAYEDSYGVPQGRGPLPGGGIAASAPAPASAAAGTGTQTGTGTSTGAGTGTGTSYAGTPPGRVGYDAPRAPGHDVQRGMNYDGQRGMGVGYDTQRGMGYDAHRGMGYDAPRGAGYDLQKGPGFDAPQGGLPIHDATRNTSYEPLPKGPAGPHSQAALANNVPYGSATPPGRARNRYEPPPRGGNPVQR